MAAKSHFAMQSFRLPFAADTSYDTVSSQGESSKHDKHFDRTDSNASDVWLAPQTPIYPDQFTPPRTKTRSCMHLLRAWAPEIISAVFGIVALLSIVIVLKVYEERSLDSIGLPRYLTLNGLIAALATLLRVFMVVPVGSALSQEGWLWLDRNTRRDNAGRGSRLQDLSLSDAASRGAWGSLILLCYSGRRWLTWLGALITVLSLAIGTFTQQLIVNTNIAVTSPGSAMRPGNIPWSKLYDASMGNPAEDTLGATLPVKAAAYNGFLADNITTLQVACPSGNCTFPQTPSLAIGGDCVATTNVLSGCNATNCNYTTSVGTTFTLANWTYEGATEGVGFQTIARENNNTANGNLTLLDFEMLGVPFGDLQGQVNNSVGYSSQRCRLWLCVNIYDTSVSNGNQQQTVVESYSDIPNNSSVSFSGGDVWNFTVPNKWKSNDFSIDSLAYVALSEQLSDMVVGTVLLNLEGFQATSDTVEAVWSGSGNTHDWIQRAALSLTNIARSTNPGNSSNFDGTGFTLGVGVRWPWLVLPSVLMVLSIVVLVLVMIQTSRSNIGVWKGSPLTMLLFDIDRNLRQRFDEVDWNGLSTGLDSHVANTRVTLRKTDRGRFQLKGV